MQVPKIFCETQKNDGTDTLVAGLWGGMVKAMYNQIAPHIYPNTIAKTSTLERLGMSGSSSPATGISAT